MQRIWANDGVRRRFLLRMCTSKQHKKFQQQFSAPRTPLKVSSIYKLYLRFVAYIAEEHRSLSQFHIRKGTSRSTTGNPGVEVARGPARAKARARAVARVEPRGPARPTTPPRAARSPTARPPTAAPAAGRWASKRDTAAAQTPDPPRTTKGGMYWAGENFSFSRGSSGRWLPGLIRNKIPTSHALSEPRGPCRILLRNGPQTSHTPQCGAPAPRSN